MQSINVNSPSGKQAIIESFFKSMDEVRRNMPCISKRKARKQAMISTSNEFNLEYKTVKNVLKNSDSW